MTASGTSVPYQLVGSVPAAAPAAARRIPWPPLSAFRQSPSAAEFHGRLREMEHSLAEEAGLQPSIPTPPLATVASAPPVVGDTRTFSVLKDGSLIGDKASDYVQVSATVKFVGSRTAVYLDDAAPAPTYSTSDIQQLGSMFNDHLYGIDTTAFGRESDIDGDGLVLILLTDRVTKLLPCTGGQVIIGFFFAGDLLPNHAGSNGGEIFYGLVPDASCGVSVQYARGKLPPVMIHEFQHMISYNQHVLLQARGSKPEATWLNEGLSSFAEELGGRLVPDALCSNNSCLTQFTIIDLDNAASYLSDPASGYLIGPVRTVLPPSEYGSGWLFVRWLMDHYATTPDLGTDLTRKLENTTLTGEDNVVHATGVPFGSLVINWQLANYLDNLPGFTPADPLLQYASWDFRATYASLHAQDPAAFPATYPLEPPVAPDGAYQEIGTLLGGSGRHLLVEQSAGAPDVSLRLTETDSTALPASAVPRIAVVRIR